MFCWTFKKVGAPRTGKLFAILSGYNSVHVQVIFVPNKQYRHSDQNQSNV